MTQVVAGSILALTVGLALARPRLGRWRVQPAAAALIGASLAVALDVVSVGLAVNTIGMLFYPVVTIVSLMAITLVAEHAGLLKLLGHYVARIARGDARKLFAYLFVAGTLTGTIFTNDAAVLIFTPLVFSLVEEVQTAEWTLENKIPFYFSVLYVGNIVGALVISNPINIIVSSFFDIRFVDYAAWMVFPAVVSMIVSFVGLRLFFRKDIPRHYRIPDAPLEERPNGVPVLACGVILALTLIAFFAEEATGVPTWLVALISAATLLAMHVLRGHSPVPLVRGIGWDVILFVVGIFIVVVGFRNSGFANDVASLVSWLASDGVIALIGVVGFLAATFSSLFNNHPTAGLMIFVIQDLSLPALETKLVVFAALIGGDLGPKMLPIGSLAALMWFRMLRARGIDVPYALYIRIGVPVTLAAVFLSLVTLLLEWLIHVQLG